MAYERIFHHYTRNSRANGLRKTNHRFLLQLNTLWLVKLYTVTVNSTGNKKEVSFLFPHRFGRFLESNSNNWPSSSIEQCYGNSMPHSHSTLEYNQFFFLLLLFLDFLEMPHLIFMYWCHYWNGIISDCQCLHITRATVCLSVMDIDY